MKVGIGSAIKWYRLHYGITQKELAELVYISEKTISSYEKNRNEPDMNTLQNIAHAFDISLSTLIRKAELFMTIQKSIFTIDGDKMYKGYTSGETWNGMACPFFNKKTGLEIAKDYIEDYKENSYKAWFDEEEDAFIFTAEEEEEIKFESMLVFHNGEEIIVYPIGASYWIWEEIKEGVIIE